VLDRRRRVRNRSFVGDNHPVAFQPLQHDEVHSEGFLPSVGRFVAGHRICKVSDAFHRDHLNGVHVVMRTHPILDVRLDCRPPVNDARDEMLRQVVSVLRVECGHFRGIAIVIASLPSFDDLVESGCVGATGCEFVPAARSVGCARAMFTDSKITLTRLIVFIRTPLNLRRFFAYWPDSSAQDWEVP